MNKKAEGGEKLSVSMAIAVEGRDDVDAVSRAVDALVIPTHGFGVSEETWEVLGKAYREKGLIILTDPDHAGEQIRKRLSERFPDAIDAFIAREDALERGDIGVENAEPAVIRAAVTKALERAGRSREREEEKDRRRYADAADLRELGLAGEDGASERRAAVCRLLGIGYANSGALVKKLRGFGIDLNELKKAVENSK